MNLILLEQSDFFGNSNYVILSDHRFKHIASVLKPDLGQKVRVGLLGGKIGEGLVVDQQLDNITLHVTFTRQPPPRHCFDIVLALPRPKVLRRILRAVAEFGVSNLYLIHSARVEKSYWQSPLLKPSNIRQALVSGLERSRDTILPSVHCFRRFKPFIQDQLPLICESRQCWIADFGASTSISTIQDNSVIMIGPEGGFVPFEIDLAQSTIARRVHLGQRHLSVDTAVNVVLAQILK